MSELSKNEKILIEEVKVVQDIIKRMATNSFNIKTWTITIIVVALLFKGDGNHIFIAFIPLLSFWYLDAYYLQQERLFREVHDWIIRHRLDSDEELFNMNPKRFKSKVDSIWKIMKSVSIIPFYGSIFVLIIAYSLIPNNDIQLNADTNKTHQAGKK
jgi:hypothetical protein